MLAFLSLFLTTGNKTSYWSLTGPDLYSCKYTNTQLHVNPNHKALDAEFGENKSRAAAWSCATPNLPHLEPCGTYKEPGTFSSSTLRLPWRGHGPGFCHFFPSSTTSNLGKAIWTPWQVGSLQASKWCLNLLNSHPKQLCNTYTICSLGIAAVSPLVCMHTRVEEFINHRFIFFLLKVSNFHWISLETMSGSSFFQVYLSCWTNLSTPFNAQLI